MDRREFETLIFGDKFEKREGWYKLFEDKMWVPEWNVPL